MGEALELQYRLPRLWARVMDGDLAGWRARRIAAATVALSREAAAFVDRHVASVAHRIGPAATDRLVDLAIATYMPAEAEKEREAAKERTFFDVDSRQVSFAGTSRVIGELDLADALDVEAAVSARAKQLKDSGSTASLDKQRAMALAEMARQDLTLDLATGEVDPTVTRETAIHVHLSPDGATAIVDETKALVTVEQVKEWCSNPFTRVVIKPVIDLDAHYTGSWLRRTRRAQGAG